MIPADIQSLSTSAFVWLDIAGIAVFATSGALVAARMRQTLVTFAFFAAITGIGGGTLRDLLIGAPVFWMQDSTLVAACLCVALAVWLTPLTWWPDRAVDWFDALGLAAYSVFGAAKALAYGVPPLPAAIMGVVTASFGGIVRDVLAGVPSIIIRPELYVTAAALSAGSYVVLHAAGVEALLAAVIAFALGFALRALAIVKRLHLPGYKG